ncbi:unnamed protein product, partial [Prorocentrum cordatum]
GAPSPTPATGSAATAVETEITLRNVAHALVHAQSILSEAEGIVANTEKCLDDDGYIQKGLSKYHATPAIRDVNSNNSLASTHRDDLTSKVMDMIKADGLFSQSMKGLVPATGVALGA